MAEPTLQEKIAAAQQALPPADDAMLAQYKKLAGFLFEATSAKTTMYVAMGGLVLQLISTLVIIMVLKK